MRRRIDDPRNALMIPRVIGDVVPAIGRVSLLSFSTAAQIIVAAQAGARIRVHGYEMLILGTEGWAWHSWTGAVATAISGDMAVDATKNKGLPWNCGWSPVGWFATLPGEHLLFVPVLGTVLAGNLWYSYVA